MTEFTPLQFSLEESAFIGAHGSLLVPEDDVLSYKLAMLVEGECLGLGPTAAALKYGYTRQRFFQLKQAFLQHGSTALLDRPRGPKTLYRRTDEVIRQVIRHRFLDPDISAEVIAQKLRQTDHALSIRSVHRILADYGVQKKTPHP